MTRIYVAGPMTGYEDYNLPAFSEAAEKLRAAGFDAVNPGERGVIDGYEWVDYMRDGIRLLLTCDAIALLPGWFDSKGAALEYVIAHDLGMPAHSVEEWVEKGVGAIT